MQRDFEVLGRVSLFAGIDAQERRAVLACLGARAVELRRGECALAAGDRPDQVGVVLEGRLHIVREDAEGGRALLAALEPGELFAEVLCCAGVGESPVTVLAETDATVLQIGFARMLRSCPQACAFHARLVENMLRVIAQKSLELQRRLELLSAKTIRERLLRYLTSVAAQQGTSAFALPFNREELADFLCVDRSALSRELARLKREGTIDYWKNQFKLVRR